MSRWRIQYACMKINTSGTSSKDWSDQLRNLYCHRWTRRMRRLGTSPTSWNQTTWTGDRSLVHGQAQGCWCRWRSERREWGQRWQGAWLFSCLLHVAVHVCISLSEASSSLLVPPHFITNGRKALRRNQFKFYAHHQDLVHDVRKLTNDYRPQHFGNSLWLPADALPTVKIHVKNTKTRKIQMSEPAYGWVDMRPVGLVKLRAGVCGGGRGCKEPSTGWGKRFERALRWSWAQDLLHPTSYFYVRLTFLSRYIRFVSIMSNNMDPRVFRTFTKQLCVRTWKPTAAPCSRHWTTLCLRNQVSWFARLPPGILSATTVKVTDHRTNITI